MLSVRKKPISPEESPETLRAAGSEAGGSRGSEGGGQGRRCGSGKAAGGTARGRGCEGRGWVAMSTTQIPTARAFCSIELLVPSSGYAGSRQFTLSVSPNSLALMSRAVLAVLARLLSISGTWCRKGGCAALIARFHTCGAPVTCAAVSLTQRPRRRSRRRKRSSSRRSARAAPWRRNAISCGPSSPSATRNRRRCAQALHISATQPAAGHATRQLSVDTCDG